MSCLLAHCHHVSRNMVICLHYVWLLKTKGVEGDSVEREMVS